MNFTFVRSIYIKQQGNDLIQIEINEQQRRFAFKHPEFTIFDSQLGHYPNPILQQFLLTSCDFILLLFHRHAKMTLQTCKFVLKLKDLLTRDCVEGDSLNAQCREK